MECDGVYVGRRLSWSWKISSCLRSCEAEVRAVIT